MKKIIWMVILLVVTAGTILMGDGFAFSFSEPTSTAVVCENCTEVPFPTEFPTEIVEPSPTEVIVTEVVEETVTPESTPIPENTPIPTETASPTATEQVVSIDESFLIQQGSPAYTTNFAHPDAGCNWQGIAGQIFDKSGDPLLNYIVKVTGIYDDVSISKLSVTGLIQDTPYGKGSYEIVISDKLLFTEKQLSIQLFDPNGNAVTNPRPFTTSRECTKNLIIMNFNEN